MKRYAQTIGLDLVGVASADPFLAEQRRLEDRQAVGHGPTPYEHQVIEDRVQPEGWLPGARAMIAVGVNYYVPDEPGEPEGSAGTEQSDDPEAAHGPGEAQKAGPRGWLSRYCRGLDYHPLLLERLQKLAAWLDQQVPGHRHMAFVDTGPPLDRAVAERAGIGKFGKHTNLITREYGTWVFLGELLTTLPLPPDPPVEAACGACTLCIDACPTGCITAWNLDANRCLSYITQMKGIIPAEYRELLGNRLFGCDDCQDVCPYNKKVHPSRHPEFTPEPGLSGGQPDLLGLMTMTKGDFKRLVAPTAAGWRGKSTLQRNALIALGNAGDPAALPALMQALESESQVLRATAAWALGRLAKAQPATAAAVREALAESLTREADQTVRQELEAAVADTEYKGAPPMDTQVLTLAAEAASHAVATRRNFHRHPELGFTEFRTASLIARRCADLGYRVKVGQEVLQAEARLGLPPAEQLEEAYRRAEAEGGDPEFLPLVRGGFTGVVAELQTGRPGPLVAMRFDIDALPILESDSADHHPVRDGFSSAHPGLMHSCGHDAHAAIGLGVAEVLAGVKEQLNGTLRLLFQPAEEGCRGAHPMVEAGMLDGVDYLIGSHIGLGIPSGHLYSMVGGYLASTKLDVTFKGLAAHAGGSPEEGRNALLGAAQAIQGLYAISRHSGGESRVNVGVLRAGTGRNVIPDSAFMMMEVRGENDEVESYMHHRARQILEGAAIAHELELEIQVTGKGVTMTCDTDLASLVAEEARKVPGLQVHDELFMSGGSEDFTVMAARVHQQGGKVVFMGLGSTSPSGHHTRTFDLVEQDLLSGIATFALAGIRLGKQG